MMREARKYINFYGKKVFLGIAVILLVVFSLFPFFWMLSCAFKGEIGLFSIPLTILPSKPTLASFKKLFEETCFLRWFKNSIIVSVATTIISLVVASLGAYSLNRFRHFRGIKLVSNLALLTYTFPPILLGIALYLQILRLHLNDSREGLVITYVAQCLPYSLWLLRAFFMSIPNELEEAALIDGASRMRALISIVFPLALPGIIAAGVFVLTLAWNEYVFALIFISSEWKKTLPLGITSFISAHHTSWDLVMAGSVMCSIPLWVFFLIGQRWLIKGWGAGGVKG